MKFEKLLPHIIAVVICLAVSMFYFAPAAFEGKTLQQGDNVQSGAMQTEIHQYTDKATGKRPAWTNQMFVGMPTYLIYTPAQGNMIVKSTDNIFFLGGKFNMLDGHYMTFLMMVLAYMSLLIFGVSPWIAVALAVSMGMMTFNLLLLEAGHSNKMLTLCFALPLLASAWMTFKGRILLGGALFAFFLATQITAGHHQITYYCFFALLFMGIANLLEAIRQKTIPTFAKAAGTLAVGGILAIAANLSFLWTTYEYTAESIRSQSELTSKSEKGSGLAKDYIFEYSYRKLETFTLLIPHFMGGGSGDFWVSDKNSNTAKEFAKISRQMPQDQAQQFAYFTSKYWGSQTMTAGPIYFGIIICFLAILGLLMGRGSLKVWIGSALLFFILLSWGDNFLGFNSLMVDYFPMYNKFRDVKMTLIVAQALVVLLAAIGLNNLFNESEEHLHEPSVAGSILKALKKDINKANLVLLAGGVTAFICIFALLYGYMGDLSTGNRRYYSLLADPNVAEPLKDVLRGFENAMQKDRPSLIQADVLKALLLLAGGVGILWLYAKEKLSMTLAIGLIGALSLLDLVLVDRNYVNEKSFVSPKTIYSKPQPTKADLQIWQDKDPHYRVLDFSRGNPATSAMTSNFHKSVGGYNAAKPRLIQELFDYYGFTNSPERLVDKNTGKLHILSMLNVKYFIRNSEEAYPNGDALGNVWFVSEIKTVANADEEIAAVGAIDPRVTATTQAKNAPYLSGLTNTPGANDKIYLTSYHPDKLTYKSSTQGERFAVFSEAYYPPAKGWHVYIDGKRMEKDFIQVNYVLRGTRIPAGDHDIEMRFEPESLSTGEPISMMSSILILLATIGALAWTIRAKMQQKGEEEKTTPQEL